VLARAERLVALGQMAANVAHQTGTPLNLVSGYVQMMREDPGIDPAIKQRLDIVATQINQVTHVLRTMLDQSRRPPHRERTALADLIERTCQLAAPNLSRAGVEIRRQLAPRLPPLDVDVAQLELALLALVTNAVDAMPTGGVLTVTAERHDDTVRVTFSDTGPGIPAELAERVFEPWFTTKPEGSGTGLGLAIVRDVVRTHGGAVAIGRAVGGGAAMIVDLPAARAVTESA
jgi:two-component system NtrC family sensor kinase